MPTSADEDDSEQSLSTRPHWIAHVGAWLLLAVVGGLNSVLNADASFMVAYLVPICIITWCAGRGAGLAACIAASAVGAAWGIIEHVSLPVTLWNAIARFSLFFAFAFLVDLRAMGALHQHALRNVLRFIGGCIAIAALASVGGLLVERSRSNAIRSAAFRMDAQTAYDISGDRLDLALLQARVDKCIALSRPLLLGSRDPNGPSCVPAVLSGDIRGKVPPYQADLDGGPGTKMAVLVFFDREGVRSPAQDFAWHQRRLRTFLENERVENAPVIERSADVTSYTRAFYQQTLKWTAVPSDVGAITISDDRTWPNYCMRALNAAIAARNLQQTQRWAGELASAAFAMEDLHRWLGFLVENNLAALNFQAKCQPLFDEPFPGTYDITATLSQFPNGVTTLNNISNYFEIERQAERLFSLPVDRIAAVESTDTVAPDALWLPPAARRPFLELGEVLSPANRATWLRAAQTPFEHSYLVNMLYRAARADQTAELKTVLRRFDANYPNATVPELMGVLVYRGHSFAGLEWGDRFQPQLLKVAEQISGSPRDILMAATKWTNDFYRPEGYGLTYTLRDAIAERRLDCVRSTDMIAAIYRNAGRTALGHVWWSAGTASHSVAALLESGGEGKPPQASMIDGLMPSASLERWPDAYFNGHAWPPTMEKNPQPYSAELYVRGIDNYVWAEGYIIRGPSAGTLIKTAIPYFAARNRASESVVYDGPHP
jgi:hypothetical protein